MKRQRRSVWQKVVAFAPLLLLVVTLPSSVVLRCRMDGQVRTSCCCPHDEERERSQRSPIVRAQSCCDQELTVHERLMEAVSAPHAEVLTAIPARATFRFDPPESLLAARAFDQRGAAREGPPLVLLKHAFLI